MSYTARSKVQIPLKESINLCQKLLASGLEVTGEIAKFCGMALEDMKKINQEFISNQENVSCQNSRLKKEEIKLEIKEEEAIKYQKLVFLATSKESCLEMGFSKMDIINKNEICFLNEEENKGMLIKIQEDSENKELSITSDVVGSTYPECKKVQEKFYTKIEEKGIKIKKIELNRTIYPVILSKRKISNKNLKKIKIREEKWVI